MQPAAHYSAAIEVLDKILKSEPAEKALLAWSRSSRFAGSKDRAAVRDIVFDCLRKKRSYAARFGDTARGLALGRAHDENELALFDGQNYSPPVLSLEEERAAEAEIVFTSMSQAFDFPEFLESDLVAEYGEATQDLMLAMRERAPVDLRVNSLKTDRKKAEDFLARDHIFTEELMDPLALRVTLNPRRLAQSRAFDYGYVELQDLSSQIVARFADAKPGYDILDYCAGGGGKTLALAMYQEGSGRLDAWDINVSRMQEIPKRAARAGVNIQILDNHPTRTYDMVFVDAPCSGSGAWRRNPDSKWRLQANSLENLVQTQREVLKQASKHVKAGGYLVYATCSILARENQEQKTWFMNEAKNFEFLDELKLNPLSAGDGFYTARFRKF